MFCPECGKQIEEGALFCPECGTKIKQQVQQPANNTPSQEASKLAESTNPKLTTKPASASATTENNNAVEEPAAKPAQTASAQNETSQPKPEGETAGAKAGKVIDDTVNKFKALDKTKKYGILGGGIAVVVLVAIVAFVMPLFGGVPADVARQAFAQNSLATNGAVSSNYTNASAYEIKDFKIDKQEDALAGTIPILVKWQKLGMALTRLRPSISLALSPTIALRRTLPGSAISGTSMATGAPLPITL